MANFSRAILLAVVFLSGCSWLESDNKNAHLGDLTISEGTLAPEFSRDELNYAATVDAATDSISVSATADDGKAKVSIDGGEFSRGNTVADVSLEIGDNEISVVVKAEKRKKTLTYVISVFRPTPTYSVGGSVAGLSGDLTLQNNGADDLMISADGAFTFATSVDDAASYDVTVASQPVGQNCTIANASGMVAGADITDVDVTCVAITYSVGGQLNGLTDSVTLQNNGSDDLTLGADGAFAFGTELIDAATYDVTVSSQPVGQTCNVTSGSGTIGGADVTDISVDCGGDAEYFVGVTVTGLVGELVLQINGARDLLVTHNRVFTFADRFVDAADYDIAILAQPTAQTCTITNGSGTIAGANVLDTTVDCTGAGVVSASIFDWEWINPLPQGSSILAFASDGNVLVGLSDAGTALLSTDGLNWTTQDTGANTILLNRIAWGGGVFVAVGQVGLLTTSTDGVAWQEQDLGQLRYWSDVVWNGSMFLTFGYEIDPADISVENIVATSPDGQAWSVEAIAGSSSLGIGNIAWNGSLFVITQFTGEVLTSPDGITWTVTPLDLAGDGIQDVASDGTQFIAASIQGHAYSSVDGMTWTLAATDAFPGVIDIEWNGSRFQAVGFQNLHTSTDGSTWTSSVIDSSQFGIGQAVTTFSGLTIVSGVFGEIYTSADDVTWTPQLTRDPIGWQDVFWDGSQFIAVGQDETIRTSPDGETWTTRYSGSVNGTLGGVAKSDTLYVVVGAGTGGTILTSPDAITWTPQTVPLTGFVNLTKVAWGDGLFVALGGNGLILTSPDGATWTQRTDGIGSTDFLRDAAWNGSTWVIVGRNFASGFVDNFFATSTDGITWAKQSLPYWLGPESIVWNAGQFVAVGSIGIARSSDGFNWSLLQTTSIGSLFDVTWTGSQFVVVSFGTEVLTSPDAINWSASRSISLSNQSVASDGSRIVVASSDARILVNDNLLGGVP